MHNRNGLIISKLIAFLSIPEVYCRIPFSTNLSRISPWSKYVLLVWCFGVSTSSLLSCCTVGVSSLLNCCTVTVGGFNISVDGLAILVSSLHTVEARQTHNFFHSVTVWSPRTSVATTRLVGWSRTRSRLKKGHPVSPFNQAHQNEKMRYLKTSSRKVRTIAEEKLSKQISPGLLRAQRL